MRGRRRRERRKEEESPRNGAVSLFSRNMAWGQFQTYFEQEVDINFQRGILIL